jgi:hypothetical protein
VVGPGPSAFPGVILIASGGGKTQHSGHSDQTLHERRPLVYGKGKGTGLLFSTVTNIWGLTRRWHIDLCRFSSHACS